MHKRSLPKRTTRGQLPLFLRETPTVEKKIKTVLKQDPSQVQQLGRQLQTRCKYQQFLNLKKYPFHRAVHYFFNLDIFPRSEGHISYAIDRNNALKNTFSNDKKQLKQCTYGQVLNRQLFGLPINQHFAEIQRRQNKHKNVCYTYLNQTEDKKYHYDRLIVTLNVILKKLKKGITNEQLRTFTVLTNDKDLVDVFDQTLSYQQKIDLVNQKIETLKIRKHTNQSIWLTDDSTYFYHALNQKLHNQITELKQKFVVQNVIKRLKEVSNSKAEEESIRKMMFQKDVCYYNGTSNTAQVQYMAGQSQPIELIFFDDFKDTIKLAAYLVAKKSESVGEVHFYEAKNMVKKLFNYELTLKSQKVQNFNIYQKNFRKKCQEIKKWRQKNQRSNNQLNNAPLFIKDYRGQIETKVTVNGKEYLMMLVFYWICRALADLKPLLSQFPQIIYCISSEYFPKVYNSLVQATQSAHVGMLCVALEYLPDMFSKPDPFLSLPFKLQIEYSRQLGVAMISKQYPYDQNFQPANIIGQEQNYHCVAKRFRYDSI